MVSGQAQREAATAIAPLLELAVVHREAGRLSQALPLIVRATELAPHAVEPKLALADLLAVQGDDQEAAAQYQSIWKKSSRAAHHYGEFILARGDAELAREVLDRAADDVLYAARVDVLLLRAEAAHRLGDWPAAEVDLQKVSRMHDSIPVTLQMIRVQIARGRYAEALALYATVEEEHPTHPMLEVVGPEIRALRARLAILKPRFGS